MDFIWNLLSVFFIISLDSKDVYLYDVVIVYWYDILGRLYACQHVPYSKFDICLYDGGSTM